MMLVSLIVITNQDWKTMSTIETYLNDLKKAHLTTASVLSTVQKNGSKDWDYEIPTRNPNYKSFRMKVNNQKLSVACDVVSQEIETILIKDDDNFDHESVYFHENADDLLEYLKTL